MSFVNAQSREINCKLVYYGLGLAGKTTVRVQANDGPGRADGSSSCL